MTEPRDLGPASAEARAAEYLGTGTADPGPRSPEELRADLSELREELGDTVEELSNRVDVPARVKARKDETVARVKDTAQQARAVVAERAPAVQEAVRRSPVPVAAGAAGAVLLGWLLLRGRRNRS
jgi:ElaB/YqjD/DUF883 family membrane-anchored ribosome-binding protein